VLALAALPASAGAAAGPILPSQDPFYTYSGSLTGVAPGTVLKSRTISDVDLGTTTPLSATQVLYRTTGEQGQPTVTVATIIAPTGGNPATRIVSYQTAYDALGSECDPSYTLQGGDDGYDSDEATIIGGYVAAGYAVVVPDYEGTNLDWGAGQESGYGTIDGVRAAEQVLGLPQGSTPVGLVGYSGGSIATEFASELAPSYAPNLDLVGVAEGGIPVDFAHNLAYVNGSQDWSGVIPAVLVGVGRAFGIDLDQYLSAYGEQVTNTVSSQCINNFLGNYPGLTVQQLLKPQYANFLSIPVFADVINHLIMSRTGTPKGPLLMAVGDADGTGDGVMVDNDVEALAHTYCRRGVSVQFSEYSGQDHDNAAVPFEAAALSFLTQRLAGLPVINGCSSIGAGNSLAPLPVGSTNATSGSPGTPGTRAAARLRLRYLGRRAHRRGVAVQLWSSTGTIKSVVVRLRRGRKVLDTIRIARVTTHKRQIVLTVRRRTPGRGRYAIVATQSRRTLATHRFTMR
jgi:Secretory lipase